MYNSIIATDMFILRGAHDLEWMDATQLADLGIERKGNMFLRDGKVVHEISKFDAGTFLSRIVTILAPKHLRSARA